jgi:hypothetical protein
MIMSRRHIMLGSAALLASLPALGAENTGSGSGAVASVQHAWVKCPAVTSVPMTSDAEQALPLRLVRSLSCGENVAVLSDAEGYTAHVRTQDGKEGYVAMIFLATSSTVTPTADLQPVSATPVNGVVRWEAGAPGCDRFMSNGRLVESVTADGITVQVSLEDTGWKFRTSLAVSNGSDSTADLFPSLVSLDELKPGLKSLRSQDPKKLSHAKEHQVLWTQSNAKPSPSAVAERSGSGATLQYASYHTQDYFVSQDARKPEAGDAGSLVALSLKPTRLQPGQKTTGVVWFERDANARELSMRVPVGNLVFDFPLSFDQKR